jgi:hypothetical protein
MIRSGDIAGFQPIDSKTSIGKQIIDLTVQVTPAREPHPERIEAILRAGPLDPLELVALALQRNPILGGLPVPLTSPELARALFLFTLLHLEPLLTALIQFGRATADVALLTTLALPGIFFTRPARAVVAGEGIEPPIVRL